MRDLFASTADAAEALGVDAPFRKQLLDARAKLRPYAIGSKGQLLEWSEEFEEPEPHHRHFSHLFGLHPGRHITAATPELFAAVRRSHELRGDEATGWSMGWKINQWARLLDGERAFQLLSRLLTLVDTGDDELSRRGRRLRQPVRRPPAVPDRRQLRRHRRHRRDAGAEPRRRDPPAAGAALGVAERQRARHPPARRLRGRPRLGRRRAGRAPICDRGSAASRGSAPRRGARRPARPRRRPRGRIPNPFYRIHDPGTPIVHPNAPAAAP